MTRALSLLSIAAVMSIVAAQVQALSIYALQGNQYAIICEDGTGYSFSGTANGAQEAGALLCDEHGGVVDITNTLSAREAMKKLDKKPTPKPGSSTTISKELDKASPKLME